MNISPLIRLFFFFFGFLFYSVVQAEVQPPFATPQQTQNFIAELKNEGSEIKTAADLFQAGVNCHNQKMNMLTYYIQPNAILFFTNDTLGNCQLTHIFLNEKNDQMIAGFVCIVSDSQYEKIFTPWYLDALKNFDQTKKFTPMMKNFVITVSKCMQQTTFDKILEIVQTRSQKSTAKDKTNVNP